MASILNSTLIWRGNKYQIKYIDANTFDDLPYDRCQQVYGVCFYKDKMVIVKGESGSEEKGWGLVGGHIENGETFEETLTREVQEETNMKVLKSTPIGYQKVVSPNSSIDYQLRYCAIVEPIRKFQKDPAGSVEEIKLIDPENYKNYFDWGEIGDRIIERALHIKKTTFLVKRKSTKK
ncbi:NUDIX hydrolase [Patescibacteria group bacterium]|nr:NUDIX hydrolase [Patescibacteria group bacterium]